MRMKEKGCKIVSSLNLMNKRCLNLDKFIFIHDTFSYNLKDYFRNIQVRVFKYYCVSPIRRGKKRRK